MAPRIGSLRARRRRGSAHVWLAHSYSNLGRGEPGPHYERAFALAADLPDRERYFILGSYYARHLLDDEKAVQAFEILTRISPDDYWSAHKLANAYHRLGRYQEATVYRLRAADLRPGSFSENASAVLYLHAFGGGAASDTPYFRRAKRLATSEITSEAPWTIAELELVPADESWLRGDLPRTLQHLEHVAQSTDSHGSAVERYLVEYTGRAYLSLGMIRAAESRFAALPDVDRRNYLMAQTALARGDEASFGRYLSLVDIAEHIADEGMDASALVASGRTGILSPARAHLVSRALANLQQGALPGAFREIAQDYSTVSRGELALARGDLDEAIVLLQQGLDRFQGRPRPVFFLAAESLADAWERRGNPESALQVLEGAATHKRRAFFDGVFRMRVQLRIAELNRTLGREGQAKEVESQLRELLLYADSDHAILEKLERLSATTGPAPPHRLSLAHPPSGT
jgi:tetratricopeptide (TPR) repeat protein